MDCLHIWEEPICTNTNTNTNTNINTNRNTNTNTNTNRNTKTNTNTTRAGPTASLISVWDHSAIIALKKYFA